MQGGRHAQPVLSASEGGGPLVTCIMPTADRRRFVPGAIADFLAQTYPHRELLILDDGREPIDDLVPPDDPRIRLMRLPQRLNVGAKRNLACREARGELIAHWDDDDWYAPARLQRQVDTLDDPAIELCGIGELLYYHLEKREAWEYRRTQGRMWLSMLCYRRRLWERHRFPEIEQGSDTRFLWSMPPSSMRAMAGGALQVCTIHGKNVSPKWTGGREWRRVDVGRIREAMGADAVRLGLAATAATTPTATRVTAAPVAFGTPPTAAPVALQAPPAASHLVQQLRVSALLVRHSGGGGKVLFDALHAALPGLSAGRAWDLTADAFLVGSASDLDEAIVERALVYVSSFQLDDRARGMLQRAGAVIAAGAAISAWLARIGVTRAVQIISLGPRPGMSPHTRLTERPTIAVHGRSRASSLGYFDGEGRPLEGGSIHGLDRVVAIARRLRRGSVVFRLEPAHRERSALAAELAALGHKVEIEISDGAPTERFVDVDVLLVASRTEGVPLEALDALAAGVAVVGAAVGELPALADRTFTTIDEASGILGALIAGRNARGDAVSLRQQRVSALDRGEAGRALAEALASVAAVRHIARSAPAPAALGGAPRILSVLMSAWRSAAWVEQAMHSVLDQRLPPGWTIELLVAVDACPPTAIAARRVHDARVTVVELAENGGTYRALNTLLALARGELVAVLDSDDVALEGRFARQIAALEAEPGLDYVGGQIARTDARLERPEAMPPYPAAPAEAFAQHKPAMSCHGTLTTRRSFYDRLGGYDDTRVGGDWELMLRALALGMRGRNLPSIDIHRRQHDDQLTRAKTTGVGSPLREAYRLRLRDDEARYRRGELPRPRPVRRTAIERVRRGAGGGTLVVMPTIPARRSHAREVLEGILRQDPRQVIVHLNGHEDHGDWPADGRVQYRLHPIGTGPAVRFDVDGCEFDEVVNLDDDLYYPHDYLARCREALARFGGAVSYHARWWPAGRATYEERKTLHFTEGSEIALAVPYVGSGVSCYPGRLSRLLAGPVPLDHARDDDLWLSIRLGLAGVRLVRPPTDAGWLRPRPVGGDSLFARAAAERFAHREHLLRRARETLGWRTGDAQEVR